MVFVMNDIHAISYLLWPWADGYFINYINILIAMQNNYGRKSVHLMIAMEFILVNHESCQWEFCEVNPIFVNN